MRRFACWLTAVLIWSALIGCAPGKSPTPPDVTAKYHALQDSIVGASPEVAVGKLQGFLDEYSDYDIAETVETETAGFRAATDGRYHEARELAREGHFDQAERILDDLVRYTPDTTDGQSARQYLKFDFHFGKAQWFLSRHQHDECEAAARELLEHDLNPYQANQVEMLLDNAGIMDVALSYAEQANTRSACRQLMVMLIQIFVEEGSYPQRLSIKDVADWGPHNSEFILRGISAIEDYRSTEQNYSFTALSSDGNHRIRVVDGQIME